MSGLLHSLKSHVRSKLRGHHQTSHQDPPNDSASPREYADEVWSLRITVSGAPPPYSDVYVYQPPLSYAGRPVWIGHNHAHYLFCEGDAAYLSPELGGTHHRLHITLRSIGECQQDFWAVVRRLALDLPQPDPGAVGPPGEEARRRIATAWWVPHRRSPLEDVVVSGDVGRIRDTIALYKSQHPLSFIWQFQRPDGSWDDLEDKVQKKIHHALVEGRGLEEAVQVPTLHSPHGRSGPRVRCRMLTMFRYWDILTAFSNKQNELTSDLNLVLEWNRVAVFVSSGQLALASPTPAVLKLLVDEGMVQPSLWAPSCSTPSLRSCTLQSRPDLETMLPSVA